MEKSNFCAFLYQLLQIALLIKGFMLHSIIRGKYIKTGRKNGNKSNSN